MFATTWPATAAAVRSLCNANKNLSRPLETGNDAFETANSIPVFVENRRLRQIRSSFCCFAGRQNESTPHPLLSLYLRIRGNSGRAEAVLAAIPSDLKGVQ